MDENSEHPVRANPGTVDPVTDEVVAAAQRGDGPALSALYAAWAPSVTGYLRAKGVSDPDATTSDVFLAVLPKLAQLTGGVQGVRTFLFSVAHARMVDDHRARARRPHIVSYEAEDDDRTIGSAEDHAHDALATERVHEILADLPRDQRDVLTLRFVADLSIEQVAQVIGRSAGAVKQLQRRGLLAVRAALADRNVTK